MKLRFEKYFLRKALHGYVQLPETARRGTGPGPVRPNAAQVSPGRKAGPDAAWGRGRPCHTEDVGLYADQILPRAINLALRGGEFAGPRARVAAGWRARC